MNYCKFNAVSVGDTKKEKPKFTTVTPKKKAVVKKPRVKRGEQTTE